MRHTRTWLYAFLPFLYVAIVLVLIGFQFSKKTDSFSQSLGDLTISGTAPANGQPADLVLRGRGMVFLFDATHFLQAEGKDGTSARLRPLSWAWKGGNITVSFQQGLQMLFEKSDGGGKSLLIHPVANDALKQIATLRIPFGVDGGVRLSRGDRGTFVVVDQNKTRILASVDGARDRVDPDNTFVLGVGKNGFRPARLDPLSVDADPNLAWLNLDSPVTPDAAEALLAKYWDKAYASWPGSTTFSSKLADAWGQEALGRNDYPNAYGRIQNVLARDPRAWDFSAVSYLGNIVELTGQQRRLVEAASSRSQPDWTGQGGLWLDAKFYGPAGSADRVKDLLMAGKLPDGAAGLLAVSQNLQTLQARRPSDAVAARSQEVLKALASRVVRREGELYVQSADGLLDLRTSLLLGRHWMTAAQTSSNTTFGPAGALLVASALGWQDAGGHLPETLVIQDGAVVRQEGSLKPEELYQFLKPEPVQETELPGLGADAFLRSPAKLVSQSVTQAVAKFAFRFPTGQAEHLILSGVPAFDHIVLHGIRWRTDPQFQSYTDGWAYSASSRTLYLKIKHREDLEEVQIFFQPEQ